MHSHSHKGFTLIELIVVISILAILAGAVIPRVTNHMSQARDAQRLSDIQDVQAAIERFYVDQQRYPNPRGDASYGGWDVSNDNDFIPELIQYGYLKEPLRDPVNDATYYYSYYLYEKGTSGCKGAGKFYVLGAKAFETTAFATNNTGQFRCSGRNWSTDFAFVTGGGTARDGTAGVSTADLGPAGDTPAGVRPTGVRTAQH